MAGYQRLDTSNLPIVPASLIAENAARVIDDVAEGRWEGR